MSLEPANSEDIATACAELRGRGPFAAAIARGLEAGDPDQMRAAVAHLIETGRLEGLRALVERFRNTRDLGVWARVTSSVLHRATLDFAAGLADIDDLMARFPERAAAHWWIARARCLEGLNRGEEAVAAAREGIARFPDLAQPLGFLANLLFRLRRAGEALEVWREAHARSPEPGIEWFLGLANALKAVGRGEEALAVLEDAARRSPRDPGALLLLAEVAEERHQWERALEIWRDYANRFAAAEPRATVGRARALFRLDSVEEAEETLETYLAHNPDDIAALRERALIAAQLGDAERARQIYTLLTRRFAGKSRPDWWASLARAHNDLRDYAAGAEALAELERRFPDSPLAEGERLRLAKELERGHDDLTAMVEAALRKFPEDAGLRAHWVILLLGVGRLDAAEAYVRALEADRARGHALISRLRLETERGDETHLRAFITGIADGRDWDVSDAVNVGDFLLGARAPWAFDLASSILEGIADRFQGNMRLTTLRIRVMIARRQDEAAAAEIEKIPERHRRREVLEMRAWNAARQGRHEEAKSLWRLNIATRYFAAVDCPVNSLTRLTPEGRLPPNGGVTAYVVFRNEAPQIPGFLAHHRRLGVKRFVFFDHMSTDESRQMLLAEPDTIVYDCPDSYQYSWSGRRWVNEVVAREGARGWGLQLDVDEYLIYPGSETVGIDRFVAYLDARGYEGVRGYMLDVFPPRLLDERGEPIPFEAYRYYDDDYVLFGQERPPYLQPSGGVRARLFQAKEFLHKTPLWRLDAGLLINSHETTHLRFADVSCALLHYKLMNVALRGRHATVEAAGTAYVEADSGVDAMRRHTRYAVRLTGLWRADLIKPGVSRELADSLALAERGLMDISADYRQWLTRH